MERRKRMYCHKMPYAEITSTSNMLTISFLNHNKTSLLLMLVLLTEIIKTKIRLKIRSQLKNNMLEDSIIWKFICNGLISYVHLRSGHFRMWLFRFIITSKNLLKVNADWDQTIYIDILYINWYNLIIQLINGLDFVHSSMNKIFYNVSIQLFFVISYVHRSMCL